MGRTWPLSVGVGGIIAVVDDGVATELSAVPEDVPVVSEGLAVEDTVTDTDSDVEPGCRARKSLRP
jgi:hypothetical protein